MESNQQETEDETRTQFVPSEQAKSKKDAEKICPWAAIIKKVDGGWHAWESVADYQTWKKQK